MNIPRFIPVLLATLLAAPAWAQSTGKPLYLKLPPSDLPVAASTAATRPAITANGNPTSAPGVYYGDHSTPPPRVDERVAAQRCDDSTYNQTQLHGSASMGVMGGNHVSGNYQAATINMTKNLGDCEHPSGGIGVSISVGQSRMSGRHW